MFKKALTAYRELRGMYEELLKAHPEPDDEDIRQALKAEFWRAVLLNDPALQVRHHNEIAFNQRLDRGWHR